MATTTLTPTSATTESPKLVKKPSVAEVEKKAPTMATQTTFGCQHIQNLLKNAGEKATDNYARMMRAIKDENNISVNLYKLGDGAKASGDVTYLCFQCPNVSKKRQAHRKEHIFSVESKNGFIFCHECTDFIYDPTFEEVRSGNAKKRKASAMQDSDTKRLISNNSTAAPCAATGLRGLYNMGQTCFMSVILQSMIHNPFIRAYYLAEGHKKEECEREACTSCPLDDIFNDFFGQEKHEGYGAVQMLQGCWKGGGGLAGYSQQDAHEYLGFILNSLHSANTAEDDDSQGSITQPRDAAARDCTCVIHQTFGGMLKSTVTCSTCKNTTTALDPFMDLSLDIRNTPTTVKKKLKLINGTSTTKEFLPMDLTECLDRFTSAETLSAEGGNYNCTTCGSAQEAKKKLSLVRLPPVIPIHLKRFRHEKTLATSSKIETKIRFPLTLDLSPYSTSSSSKSKADASTSNGAPSAVNNSDAKPNGKAHRIGGEDEDDWNPPDPVYELSSIVVHKGKIDNGHYVSYSRQGEDWFRFDDSMVVQVDEKEAMGVEAYMLFYVIRDLEG